MQLNPENLPIVGSLRDGSFPAGESCRSAAPIKSPTSPSIMYASSTCRRTEAAKAVDMHVRNPCLTVSVRLLEGRQRGSSCL